MKLLKRVILLSLGLLIVVGMTLAALAEIVAPISPQT